MENVLSKIISNEKIAKDVYRIVIFFEQNAIINRNYKEANDNAENGNKCKNLDSIKIIPGQFVNILLDGLFLRRPISICDYSNGKITLVYKVLGQGTKILSMKKPGEKLDILLPLGNGFDIFLSTQTRYVGNFEHKNKFFDATNNCESRRISLVGGGVGVPPLYYLTKKIIEKMKVYDKKGSEKLNASSEKIESNEINPRSKTENVEIRLGFKTKEEVILEKEFAELGINLKIFTEDGSYGEKGFVTKDLNADYVFCCGPEPMLKAIYDLVEDGQFSFEERMGCGFGACMGCSCQTKYGYKRICKEGPILQKNEVLW
ncbi:MAG: dihydroorotate dehydrogenase electron transfer subunit [Anaerovoracaceae bacterium]